MHKQADKAPNIATVLLIRVSLREQAMTTNLPCCQSPRKRQLRPMISLESAKQFPAQKASSTVTKKALLHRQIWHLIDTRISPRKGTRARVRVLLPDRILAVDHEWATDREGAKNPSIFGPF